MACSSARAPDVRARSPSDSAAGQRFTMLNSGGASVRVGTGQRRRRGLQSAAMVEQLAATVLHLAETVEQVAATVEQFAETVLQDAATVEQPAATVEQVAATVEHAAATVEHFAETVEQVAATVEHVAATVPAWRRTSSAGSARSRGRPTGLSGNAARSASLSDSRKDASRHARATISGGGNAPNRRDRPCSNAPSIMCPSASAKHPSTHPGSACSRENRKFGLAVENNYVRIGLQFKRRRESPVIAPDAAPRA